MADIFSAMYGKKNPYFEALLREGMSSEPISSHWQGANRLANALLLGMERNRQDTQDNESRAMRMNLPGLEGSGDAAPQQSRGLGGIFRSLLGEQDQPTTPPQPAPRPTTTLVGDNPDYGRAISSIESGGKYDAQGPVTKTGDRAYGKYQVMGSNVGPWSKAHLGREITPEQFLADPQAQDAVFKGQFGQYAQKYGPEGAARAWFAGEGGMNDPNRRDQLGTSVAQYGQKFAQAAGLPQGGQPPQAMPQQAQAPQMPQPQIPQPQAPGQGVAPQRAPVQIDPGMARQIKAMLGSRDPAIQQQGYALYQQYAKPREETRPLTDPRERARYGIQPTDTNPYQVDAKGEVKPINPQPFAVNVNQQAESEFSKEAGKLHAKRFDELAGEAVTAKQMQSDVSMLRDLGAKIGTGKLAEAKAVIGPYADALGIKVDGLSEIQAFEAIVNRVAPQMRVKGTGAQSDYELRNFLKQFPSIGNTPEGNAIVDRTLQALIQNKITAAEIGSSAMTGEITRKEAEKRLRELPDAMKEWREFSKALPKQAPSVDDLLKKYGPK